MKPIYKAREIPLEGLILAEPLIAYKKVREANKGFKTNYITALIYIHFSEGLTCSELAYSVDRGKQWAYVHLGLLISAGYVVKREKTYYCTDLGHKIVLDALQAGRELIANVTREVIKRAKRAKVI